MPKPLGVAFELLALALVIAVVFGRAVLFPFVNIDDATQIVANPLVTSPGTASPVDLFLTPGHGYIVPVTALSQAALWAIGDGAPWPFHLANLVLHVGLCSGLMMMMRPHGVWAARLAAVVLALHPLVVEPVAWATGIKDLWCASFIVLGTWCFVRGAGGWGGGEASPRARRWLVAAVSFAFLAILSKPTALLIGWAWLAFLVASKAHAEHEPRADAWRFAWVAALLGVVLGLVDRLSHDTQMTSPDSTSVGLILQVLGRQAVRLVWPGSLHPTYYVDLVPPSDDAHTVVGVVVLVGFALLGHRMRASPRAVMGLGIAFFTYLPVSNVLPFTRKMADSYLYLPMAGLLLALAPPLEGLLARAPAWSRAMLIACFALPLGLASHVQLDRWSSNLRLWEPVVADFPQSAEAQGSLAAALVLDDQYERAVEVFERSFARGYTPDFLNDYGVALAEVGRFDDAECVMVEAAFHSAAPLVALQNLAVLTFRNPQRELAYEPATLHLLFLAAHATDQGDLELDRRTRWSLQRLKAQLSSPPPAPRWPLGQCPLLRSEPAAG